jgi:hypothetical protein
MSYTINSPLSLLLDGAAENLIYLVVIKDYFCLIFMVNILLTSLPYCRVMGVTYDAVNRN